MRRTALTRRTPLRKRRPTPRTHKFIVRLEGADLRKLRMDCWLRDLCSCVDCGVSTLWNKRFDGDPLAYEMAHIRTKRNNGDTLDNVKTLCAACHRREHGGC